MGEFPTPSRSAHPEMSSDGASVDLQTFVENICLLRNVSSPFIALHDWLMKCYRWHHPRMNLLILFFVNGFWYQTGVSLLVVMLLSFGFLSLIGLKTEIFSNSFSSSYSMENRRKEIYAEFYQSIIWINSAVLDLTKCINFIYEIIRWDNFNTSLKAYAQLIVYGSVLYLSFSYSFMILMNIFMLRNLPKFLGPMMSGYWYFDDEPVENLHSAQMQTRILGQSPYYISAIQDQTKCEIPSGQGASSPYRTDDAASSSETIESDRYCHGCEASFGYILKRRHYCRHCGDRFCWNCCNQLVPRYYFGATAPAAKTETVVVCQRCYVYLTEKFGNQASIDVTENMPKN